MKVSIKFYEKIFKAKDTKDAYLKLCKWLAKNVISKAEASETTFNITKVENTGFPAFKLELYCNLEEKDIKDKFCEICKQFHKSFYINQEYNCSSCKLTAYKATLDKKLTIKRSYKKERLNYILDKTE